MLGKESADKMRDALLSVPLARSAVGQAFQPVAGTREGAELLRLKHLIIDKTEGNPFFMEEMVQNLFVEGALVRNREVKLARPLSIIQFPPMTQSILATRTFRLPPSETQLLRTLAALGKTFCLIK